MLIITALILTVALIRQLPEKADRETLQALLSDKNVLVEQNTTITFRPGGKITEQGLIFYGETAFKPSLYAPLCRQLAEEQITVFLMRYPLNLPWFDRSNPEEITNRFPEVKNWTLAGHGAGGNLAAGYMKEQSEKIQNLILLGSAPKKVLPDYPGLRVLSLYGTFDKLTKPEKIEERKCRLPVNTRYVEIEGGNHSQFASLDKLPSDGFAAIHRNIQKKETAEEMLYFIRSE